jgi:polyribonucleotide nucleotidyltransferase
MLKHRRSRAARRLQEHRQAERYAAVDAVKAKVKATSSRLKAKSRSTPPKQVGAVFKDLQAKIVRWNILDTGSPHRRP